MKKHFTPKTYLLVLFLIPLLSSCKQQCDQFSRQSELLTIGLFPQDRTTYEFRSTDDDTNVLNLTNRQFDFSEAYEIDTSFGADSDCYSNHITVFSFDSLPFSLENEMAYDFIDSDAEGTFLRYWAINQDNQIIDGISYELPYRNDEIQRDINNLTEDQITVNGETFRDVLRVDMSVINMTLFVERNRGLQGILYQGELYTRVN